jgi:RNA polymerase sigma-70 factor (ECF subfamily)
VASDREPVKPEIAAPAASPDRSAPSPDSSPVDEEFVAFYREFSPILARFLLYHGASLHVTADLVQETMTKAYQRWPTLEHPAAWVRRVGSRAFVRHIARVEEDPVEEVPEPSSLLPPPTEVEAWEQRQDLLHLLAHLPWRQRQVMAWTLDGHTPTQIADELQISPAAVRASLKKARHTLAILLDPGKDQR